MVFLIFHYNKFIIFTRKYKFNRKFWILESFYFKKKIFNKDREAEL